MTVATQMCVSRCGASPRRAGRKGMTRARRKNFGLWDASMGHLFQGREHRAFASLDAAERFLGVPLDEREPYLTA